MSAPTRIYDARYDFDDDHMLTVEEDVIPTLNLTIINEEDVATIELDADGVKKLRLALQRFERRMA